MITTRSKELEPGFRWSKMAEIKGTRTWHIVTLNPNKGSPGEEIYIDIPKLKTDTCLVPDSLNLQIDFKNANAKSWFLNNLSKLLCERFVVKFAGVVCDNTGESIIGVYRDLWKTSSERDDMVEHGIAGENLRKLISKDDSGASSGNNSEVSDGLMFTVHGTKQKIKLGKILEDHGQYTHHSMTNNLQYITLPKATDIMVSQSGQSVGGYTLENLELEYETVENQDLVNDVISGYVAGRSLSYEHATLMRTTEWDKSSTLVNKTINLPRKSMKAVVLLFRNKTVTDSEEYVYPNIESIKVTIEGISNSVYSQGIPKSRLFEEAGRVFKLDSKDQFMSIQKFYKDHFALVVDLRTVNDSFTSRNGKKLVNTQFGLLSKIRIFKNIQD